VARAPSHPVTATTDAAIPGKYRATRCGTARMTRNATVARRWAAGPANVTKDPPGRSGAGLRPR
jgi:hypothetical protein